MLFQNKLLLTEVIVINWKETAVEKKRAFSIETQPFLISLTAPEECIYRRSFETWKEKYIKTNKILK